MVEHERSGRPPRSRWRAVTVAALVCAGLVGGPLASASPRPTARPASPIRYSARTVVVPAATVSAQLLSASADGATYTFRSATGPLGRLKPGSVMLLQNLAVRDVTSVRRPGGRLVVATTPAAITDLVADGSIAWNTPVDFAKGFALGGSAVPVEQVARREVSGVPAPGAMGLRPLTGGGVTLKGKTDSYDYSVTFKTSGSAVSVAITLGKSTPIDMSVTITGTLDNVRTSGDIAVANGKLAGMKMVASGLKGQFKLAYSAKPISQFGLGTAGGIKITIPGELTVPFDVGGIPLFLGIKTAFFASVGFSSFDQELTGSYQIDYDGSGGFTTSSSGATSPAGAAKGIGDILLNAANAVGKGPLSFIFGAQIPQLELGLGVKGLNVGGFVTLIVSTGIATSGPGCDTRQLQVQGSAGAEASFFGLSASLGSATLFSKQYQASYPKGCGTFP